MEKKIVYVEWLDPFILEGRNIPISTIEEVDLAHMESVGFLLCNEKNCIKLSSLVEKQIRKGMEEYGSILVIAKKLILRMIELKEINKKSR